MDGLLLFSSAQALTTGTAASTNVIDLLNARNMGIGDDPALKIACFITTAFAGGTSLVIQAQGSTDNSTYTTYAESRTLLTAELLIGAKLFPIDWPANGLANSLGNDPLPRYLRLAYVMANAGCTFTTGAVTAALVLDRQDYVTYPAGINISN